MTQVALNADGLPPGLVAVSSQDTGRYTLLGMSIERLEIPAGSVCEYQTLGSLAENRNLHIRNFLTHPEWEWIWFLDDDHAFWPSLLLKLLQHGVDAVTPVCLTRVPPFSPIAATGWADDEHTARTRIDLNDHPEGGLVEIQAGGGGIMLVQRRVLEALDDPWFSPLPTGEGLGEDLHFCDKARAEGFKIYLDLDTQIGHLTSTVVWPASPEQNGSDRWSFGLGFPNGYMILLPPDWMGQE